MRIRLLHGTETGTAEMLCEDLQAELQDELDIALASLEDVAPNDLVADDLNVFIVSTTGSGELPYTAIAFMDQLKADAPDLSQIRFAMFGLGDTTFSGTYNQGSQQVMDKLLECGARQVGARGIFDASGADMPEEVALPWLRETLGHLNAA